MQPVFQLVEGSCPIVATAIHAGHDLRPEIEERVALSAETRRREEDPHTDRFTEPFCTRVTVARSRFEVDLNRPRDEAVYRTPEQAWGLEVYQPPLTDEDVEASLASHDAFYTRMADLCDGLAQRGGFVVLDLHSYNHRRDGATAPPAPPEENPDVNLGTSSLDVGAWRPLADRFVDDLMAGLPASTTFGENVRFQGGFLSKWVNERYPNRGCALAIEFKKTFMDEWTDEVDETRMDQIVASLDGTVPGLLEELGAP
jgi:N-formylglutamate deformylase